MVLMVVEGRFTKPAAARHSRWASRGVEMKTIFRTTDRFLADVRRDLARPHRFAAERVGFISIRAASTATSLVLLGESYHPVADDDYIDDTSVGAMMGQESIRKALNIALLQPVGMIHVH